ncbi:MAG: tRNA pseudouridine(38-40) synthase TruA [Lachnospiraceae bacterium]|nr:tRNA pseudouridine(38-40) synthase TruA [Lachnospiraceae bacterium]
MQNYRMLVQYDGSRYNGWQKQGDTDNTIQNKLETVLSRMTGSPVDVHGAGRTDAGVHARGQVAQFRAETDLRPAEIRDYLNSYLPDDIGVLSVDLAAPRFHSRYNASTKYYLYRIGKNKAAHVFERKYLYEYRGGELDTHAMKLATLQLIGTHDFRSFCGNSRMNKSTVRTIHTIRIDETPDEIQIGFVGDGFLQYMIRIMVGTLIEVGEGKRDPESLDVLLEARSRRMAGPTAPAQGLTLMEVRYN